jgi:PAS domain S-box-containing protein
MKTRISGQNIAQLSLEELKSSLQMYRQLVDNIREVLWIVSHDWQEVIYISPAYEQVWGRSCESLRLNPLSWIDSVHEEDRERVMADIEKRSKGQLDDPFFPDYRILRSDGTVRWISARAYPVQDEQGHVSRIAGIAEDITEQVNAVQALSDSEGLLRSVTENIPSTYLSIIDKDMTVGFTSGEEFRKQGLDPEAFVGLSIDDVFGEHAPYIGKQYRRAFSGEEIKFELTMDGQHQEYKVMPLADEDGAVNRVLAFVENVTERKEAARKVQESEEKFHTAFRTSPDSITISRMSDGMLVDVNKSFLTESGFSRKEAIGKSTVDLGLWADPSEREHFISLVAEKGSVTNFEMSFRTGAGEVGTSLLSASSFLLEGQPHLLTIVRDITERVAWEDALRDSEEKFRTAFRTSPDSITISRTSDGLMVEINEGFTARTGYTSEEVMGKTAVDLGLWVDPSERDRFVSLMAEKGSVENLEMDFRTKDGAVRTGLMSVSALILGGEPHHISIIRDITGMKESQEAVRRERDLIDRLMETSPVGITVVGKEGQINFANRRAMQILGLEKDRIQERTYNDPEWQITDFVGKPVPDDELPFMRVKSTSEPILDVRHAILWPNGRMVKLSINAAPLFDELDQFDGMVASIEDITERMVSDDTLRESEERFRNIVQSSPMGMHMYRLEPDGRLVFVGANPVADRVLGVDNSQFIGKTIEEAFPPLRDTEVPGAYRADKLRARQDQRRLRGPCLSDISEYNGGHVPRDHRTTASPGTDTGIPEDQGDPAQGDPPPGQEQPSGDLRPA